MAYLITIALFDIATAATGSEDGFKWAFHTVPLDHFGENSTKHVNRPVFALKCAFKLQHYRPGGPLFFHPGGQEPMDEAMERVVSRFSDGL
jgi:hypothetical protein